MATAPLIRTYLLVRREDGLYKLFPLDTSVHGTTVDGHLIVYADSLAQIQWAGIRGRQPGSGMRDAGPESGSRDPRSGMRDPGCGIRDPGCGIRHPGCGIRARCPAGPRYSTHEYATRLRIRVRVYAYSKRDEINSTCSFVAARLINFIELTGTRWHTAAAGGWGVRSRVRWPTAAGYRSCREGGQPLQQWGQGILQRQADGPCHVSDGSRRPSALDSGLLNFGGVTAWSCHHRTGAGK